MQLLKTTCPHCGAPLIIDQAAKQAVCEYCGMTTILDQETTHIEYTNSEQAGYDFEKGRLRAQAALAPSPTVEQVQYEYVPVKKKRRHTFWWVMGWIFIFPIPATILFLRSKMPWFLKVLLILLVWALYFAMAASAA